MNLLGRTTINPLLFYSGKIAGYFTWIMLIIHLPDSFDISLHPSRFITIYSCSLAISGLLIVMVSLFNLGGSTRLGIPDEETVLKTGGIYRLSRNPMYLGFNLFTISSMIFNGEIITALMGVYSIIIYHFIILGEEKFLEERFGPAYLEYKNKAGRYF